MIYFCADDYGLSREGDRHIENCITDGVLNKVSVLPNGILTDFKQRLSEKGICLAMHINLVEGAPLSNPKELDLLVSDDGYFKYSFVGLFFLSFSTKRKKLEKQLHQEIRAQVTFWKKQMGENTPVFLDSHQHTHMIPLIFRVLLRVIEEENLKVASLRIPAEPLMPFLLTPSLYLSYGPTGIIRQWLLKVLAVCNDSKLKRSKIPFPCFMGAMFSGRMTEDKIKKLLPHYMKIAEKQGKDIEIALHPGYIEQGEKLIDGYRTGFEKAYFSPWRKKEYHVLQNFYLEQ